MYSRVTYPDARERRDAWRVARAQAGRVDRQGPGAVPGRRCAMSATVCARESVTAAGMRGRLHGRGPDRAAAAASHLPEDLLHTP
jgi:hypothetical protein